MNMHCRNTAVNASPPHTILPPAQKQDCVNLTTFSMESRHADSIAPFQAEYMHWIFVEFSGVATS